MHTSNKGSGQLKDMHQSMLSSTYIYIMQLSATLSMFSYIIVKLACDWPTGCYKLGNDNGCEGTKRGAGFEQEWQVMIYYYANI